jgi:glutamine amidotransferase
MSKTVAVVDYGMGNLRSVSQAVQHVAQGSGYQVVVTSRPQDVRDAERIVLPGQGAMRDCMRELRESGLLESVLEAAASKPLFGVCVGMQMLLDRSEEGPTEALGLIHGERREIRPGGRPAARWQPLQGAADGVEPGPAVAAAPPVGGDSGRQLLLFRAQLYARDVGCAPQRGRGEYGAALYRRNCTR